MGTSTQELEVGHAEVRLGIVLALLCAGMFLVSVDLFVVNVALPYMARDFGARALGGLSWVINAYTIVYAALLVLGGRLADNEGHKRVFLLGAALFVSASAACGAASSVPALVAYRVIQGAGAALLSSGSLGLILAFAPPDRREAAVRTWTAAVGVGAAVGPVIGGLLVTVSWRAIFFINVPIGLITLLLGIRLLPGSKRDAGPRPDALGAVLVTGGAAALTLGIVQGGSWGWGSTATVAVLAGAALALASFVLHCLRHRNPLVEPGLFRSRAFSGVAAAATILMMSFGGMLLSMVLWVEGAWHYSALTTGLAIAPGALMVPIVAGLLVGRAIARLGAGVASALGAGVFGLGVLWWVLAIGPHPDYPAAMLGGMLLVGAGFGLSLPTFLAAATGPLPPQSYATGAGVINMLRQIGTAVGVAVVVAILGGSSGVHAGLGTFRTSWIVIAALAGCSAVASLIVLPRMTLRSTLSAEPSAPALQASGTVD
ncbi:MAG TPA: MFS transporter [Solirubrobacteraceae bacterium]|nr:MFS transporter [Solirubrobacteraceae bacterium]